MTAFDLDNPDDAEAYRLVAGGPVTLFYRQEVLGRSTAWLSAHGYDVVQIDCREATCKLDLLDQLAIALRFPAYFGRNLDALNDCLRDVADHSYGFALDAVGSVLVLLHYDAFTRCEPHQAWVVLDIVADRWREAALTGHRMMCLVQSDDPGLSFRPVGATPVMWNGEEWLTARRQDDH
ncbi:barstar family protein [Microlunatus antarcticus]|uniref:Barstar (barnase inhibitor) domain-containing protein n=1 Tax=Microlunatus antarcticus TaxID=53388 RepID=A0A7W5JTJ0_9ACTN|nr:barstar family protein [Microlunatus antarcticus]MBB3326008.1 hypothetical protein [Microlunatus antarcticus]